jgi:hypothetical protein
MHENRASQRYLDVALWDGDTLTSLYLRLVLSDEEERPIRDLAAAADRGTLLRWVGELLEDRKERSALLQQLARQPSLTRSSLAVNSAPPLDANRCGPWCASGAHT